MAETIVASHGLFYMENAGGCKDEPPHSEISPSMGAEERSCFALEDERGEGWNGSGAMGPAINETRPSL
jgi:hypothetical protein